MIDLVKLEAAVTAVTAADFPLVAIDPAALLEMIGEISDGRAAKRQLAILTAIGGTLGDGMPA